MSRPSLSKWTNLSNRDSYHSLSTLLRFCTPWRSSLMSFMLITLLTQSTRGDRDHFWMVQHQWFGKTSSKECLFTPLPGQPRQTYIDGISWSSGAATRSDHGYHPLSVLPSGIEIIMIPGRLKYRWPVSRFDLPHIVICHGVWCIKTAILFFSFVLRNLLWGYP